MKKEDYFELGIKIMNVIFMLFSLLVYATPCFYKEVRMIEDGVGQVVHLPLKGYEMFTTNPFTCTIACIFVGIIVFGIGFFIYEIFSKKRNLYIELSIYAGTILSFLFLVSRLTANGYIYISFAALFFIGTYIVKFRKKINERFCFYLLFVLLAVLLPSGMALSQLYL